MPKKESPMHELAGFLPEGSFDDVLDYLHRYKVHLTITRERLTKLGDYRNRRSGLNHRISVNGNLNKYAFLITLLHELGHLLAFEKYGHRIAAHGQEWKNEFSSILEGFITKKIFPADIRTELLKTLRNPAASTCAEASLTRVLKKYDADRPGIYLLEELPDQSLFKFKSSVYLKEKKMRTRFLCKDAVTQKRYLFSPITEVELVKN